MQKNIKKLLKNNGTSENSALWSGYASLMEIIYLSSLMTSYPVVGTILVSRNPYDNALIFLFRSYTSLQRITHIKTIKPTLRVKSEK